MVLNSVAQMAGYLAELKALERVGSNTAAGKTRKKLSKKGIPPPD
jgi:hypothetical protein